MPYTSGMCLELKNAQNRQVRPQSLCAPLLALLIAGPLSAATVYKTVDENGVVSYSDTAPASEQEAEVMVIDVPASQDSESAQEQLEAMRETTDRMVADRQQREKHRAEMRKLQAESEPQVIEYGAPADSGGIYTGYYPYPVYRPGGGYRPRPTHPIARPPLRPRPGYPPREDIISPGHDYPASLIRRGYSPEVRAAFEK
jgi:TolA-binding protein